MLIIARFAPAIKCFQKRVEVPSNIWESVNSSDLRRGLRRLPYGRDPRVWGLKGALN